LSSGLSFYTHKFIIAKHEDQYNLGDLSMVKGQVPKQLLSQ